MASKTYFKLINAGIFICTLIIWFYYVSSGGGHETTAEDSKQLHNPNRLFTSWRRCMMKNLENYKANHTKFWEEGPREIQKCDKPFVDILKIRNYDNYDERKHHIHPIGNHSKPSVVVSLGIGHDITAEQALLKAIGKDKIRFYGADPMVEINEDLYSKIGKFYPFAVSAKAGYSRADVLQGERYSTKSVVYVDAVYFLTEVIGLKFFDNIWMDAEYGEYEMFPLLLKGGGFDKAGVTICQMHIEIHQPNMEQKKSVRNFIFNSLQDESIQISESCLASYNPDTIPTTTIPVPTTTELMCPCTISSDIPMFCPTYMPAAGPATLVIMTRAADAPATDPICTLTLSGCSQYRAAGAPASAPQCSDNGAMYNPTDVRAVLDCDPTTGLFGGTLAYDCLTV